MTRKIALLAGLASLLLAFVAVTGTVKPTAADSSWTVNCLYGQGCQAIGNVGPGGIYVYAVGADINGRPVQSDGAGGYCSDSSCGWSFNRPGNFNIAWYAIDVVDDSWSTFINAWCTGSGSGLAAPQRPSQPSMQAPTIIPGDTFTFTSVR